MKLKWLVLPLIAVFVSFSHLSASTVDDTDTPRTEHVVIEENNLQKLSEEMKRNKLGLVIMFHAEYCDFCDRLEHELLQPMVRSGEYDDKVLIRKIQVDGAYDLVNFNGQQVSSDQLTTMYDASMTPTLVFLDAEGAEQAERILGYTTPDFFAAYVERAINKLHKAVSAQ
ncbi:thioredoxin family protein [Leucothrix pacifica]|uniref:Thioredoxin-like fold domain-containing protein n=1 Tax=Leucothrix pacifica TaxID=1247513 RepID=A0A317C7K5_9GAMM|nr:thioredoxin fold domain-containing protein [Leucothrix pacifica]PWQ94309.1 hypothetical protein DKW60_16870 [Leucothrix pacifica]